MIPLELAASFFATCAVLAWAPGPDNIFVFTQSVTYGRQAGWFATLGFCCGCLIHTAAVTLGVTALIAASPAAFRLLKLAGAGYLVALAIQAFRASSSAQDHHRGSIALTRGQTFRRGMIMNITNPKVSLFFLAFLPLFTDPHRGSVSLQLLTLGGLFTLCTLLVFGGIACLGGAMKQWLRPGTQRIIQLLAGIIYLALAGYIATAQL